MSNGDDDDETGGAIIILSVEIPPELAECLDRKAKHGPFGANRAEVAQLYLCNSFGVEVPARKVPEQAAPVAEEAADDSDKAAPTPEELAADEPTTPGDSGE